METEYAILINGEWGSGKTHYYKEVLKPLISEISVFSDEKKKYKNIYISLFGLSSIEQIESQIFLELYPILKKEGIKLARDTIKIVAKGALSLLKLGDFNELFDLAGHTKAFLNFSELVICFDDFERIHPELEMNELLGFINSLVESGNRKVILIANQSKVEKEDYKKLKEKVVQNTIEFELELPQVFDNILSKRFGSSFIYKDYIVSKKSLIINQFSKGSKNLRTLIFAISYFQHIYSVTNEELSNNETLYELKSEILDSLLKFTISIAIEYQIGAINYKERKDLDLPDYYYAISEEILRETEKVVEENIPYSHSFYKKYFWHEKLYFYHSIYNFITGGEELDSNIILEEIKLNYNIKNNILPEHYKLLSQLAYDKCFDIPDREYLKKTSQLYKYMKTVEFELKDYLTIFHFLTRFGNPLKFNIDKLEARIKTAMNKAKKKLVFNPVLKRLYQLNNYDEYQENLQSLFSSAIEINMEIKNENEKSAIKRIERIFYEDYTSFFNSIIDKNDTYKIEPIFHLFDRRKFFYFLNRADNNTRLQIKKFLDLRYSISLSPYLKNELPFWKSIFLKVEKKSSAYRGKNISGFVWSELEESIKSIITKLETAQN